MLKLSQHPSDRLFISLLSLLFISLFLGCSSNGGGNNDNDVATDSPIQISQVRSSVFSDGDDIYATGRMVRIDVEGPSSEADIVSGTIRIKSTSTGYDSGIQALTFGSIFYNWDTTGVEPANDYVVEVTLIDSKGERTFDNSLTIILAPNPPSINKLVSQLDLAVPAIGNPVRVIRTYLLDSGFNSSLGFGWTHSYLMHVVETGDGLVKVFNSDGSGSFFSSNGDVTYEPPKGDYRVLIKDSDGTLHLSEKYGTNYLFNTIGKLITIGDRNDNIITLSYGNSGLLETITDASMQVTTFSYDANNRLSGVIDPAGRTIAYGYDNVGNLTSFKDIGGLTTYYDYDANHNLTTITDPAGRQTFFTINEDDRLTSVSNTGGANLQTFEYGVPTAYQMTITDALGNKTILTYNNDASITETIDPLGNKTIMTYDDDFNLIERMNPAGNTSNFTYDDNSNLVTVTDAQRNTLSFTYAATFHSITSQTDANGNTTVLEYDANGNLIERNYPNGNIETFSYDGHGNLISLIDANGNTTSFDYDAIGQLTTMTYPDGSQETFSYDSFSNMINKTDRKGQNIQYAYDLQSRLVLKLYPDGKTIKYVYDATGNLLSAEDENGSIVIGYDDIGRVGQVTDSEGQIVSYKYDELGNRTQLTYPDGMVLNYNYDTLSRLTHITESGQTVANYEYDQLSRVIRRWLKNGTYTTYDYDDSNRLLELINYKSTVDIISSFAYTYDNVGNRLGMTTLEGLTQYTYDEIYQLTKVIYPDGSTTSYNLDPAGNRISEIVDGNAVDYTANDLNQYTEVDDDSYSYDANGNMTSKTTSAGTTFYTYDFENRLMQVDTLTDTISYSYDPLGRRTSKTSSYGTTNYIHDGFRVIVEMDGSDKTEATYIHGIGIDEVLVMERDGKDYFYSQDGLGSVTDLTDSTENIIESFTYDAFGIPSHLSIVDNPFMYTGREYEYEAGLYYYRDRYYNPSIGKFITIDPISYLGGINMYGYVQNNPINFIDPNGQARIGTIKKWYKMPHIQIFFRNPVYFNGKPYKDIGFGPGGIITGENINNYFLHPYEYDDKRLAEAVLGVDFDDDWDMDDYWCFDWMEDVINGYFQLMNGDPTFIQGSKSNIKNNVPKQTSPDSTDLFASIAFPYEQSLIRANVPIFGQAYGEDFKDYRIEYGVGDNPIEWFHINTSTDPETNKITSNDLDDSLDITIYGNLATWDTGLRNYVYLPSHPKGHPINLKGTYTIRLVVTGKDGVNVEDRVTVDVANVIPNALGGKAISSDGRAILSVPEHALVDSFRLILIDETENEQIEVPPNRKMISNIYKVREPGEQFTKAALLKMACPKETMVNNLSDHLGIYGYDSKSTEWEYIDSQRDDQNNLVVAKVRKLHSYYAIMASEGKDESSVLEPTMEEDVCLQQENTVSNNEYTLVKNTFEDGLCEWSNRDHEVGGAVSLDDSVTYDGTKALKISNRHVGGNFAVNVLTTPFDARDYPLVQFDYRIPSDVKTNFLVKVSGRWYDIGFTDDPKLLKDKRVNIAHIGDINNIITDDRWHTGRFNLYEMLRTKTGHTRVDEMIMADWDVDGYMKLSFGQNAKDATYYIDNFTISKESLAGLRIDSDSVLIDNFNQMNLTNVLGGRHKTFMDSNGEAKITLDFDSQTINGIGHALKLQYDVSNPDSYAGYTSSLLNLDLREYQYLTFLTKGITKDQDCRIGIKDSGGHESKVQLSRYLQDEIVKQWQRVNIPLSAFKEVEDWSCIDNISFGFDNSIASQSTMYVDDMALHKVLSELKIDDFEHVVYKNNLGKQHNTFVSGNAAVNARYTKGSPNGILRISYGGNIGKIGAYASDLKSFAGWRTGLGGIDCSECQYLNLRVRGAEGGENFTVYLGDGNFRWGVDIAKYAEILAEWQTITIPLDAFSEYGVDLTHLDELQVVFEGHPMSGTIYLDDLSIESDKKMFADN